MTGHPGNIRNIERRGKMRAVPLNYRSMLNQDQKNALRNIEKFGWQLAFVRRRTFESPVFVVSSTDRQRFAIIEGNGEVNIDPDLVLRH